MKKIILAFVALFVMTVQASAMSYEQARQQALFLTDKMAYELNLTDDQYEAAYEINLDYLLNIRTHEDLYGTYWRYRNLDMSYILFDWQYRAFCEATYFYRPLYWSSGVWHFAIYARYPHRDYFYFGRPHFYVTYHGGHSWHSNGGRSWYYNRSWGAPHNGNPRVGMRDGFDRGNYGGGVRIGNDRNYNNNVNNSQNSGYRSFGNGSRTSERPFGGSSRSTTTNPRQSSTRTTVTKSPTGYGANGHFGGNNIVTSPNNSTTTSPRSTFSPSRSAGSAQNNSSVNFGRSTSGSTRSFGQSSTSTRSSSSHSSGSTRSFGGSSSSSAKSTGGHFGRR